MKNYEMKLYEDLRELDGEQGAQLAKMIAGATNNENIGDFIDREKGKVVIAAYEKVSGEFTGFMALDISDKKVLEVKHLYQEDGMLSGVFGFCLKEFSAKKKKQEIKIQVDSFDWDLRDVFEKQGFMYTNIAPSDKLTMKCRGNPLYLNIAKILNYLEGKVAKSGRTYDYFTYHYKESGKKFILYLERELGFNVSTYLNSPKLYGVLLLSQEMAKSNVKTTDFAVAYQMRDEQPQLFEEIKKNCPNTFANFEKQIPELCKIVETLAEYRHHLRFKQDEDASFNQI